MRRPLGILVAAALAAGLLVAGPGATPTARGFPAEHVEFTGRGFGHGRGMGQFGALGYALEHGRTYQQILDHYYGGTTFGASLGNPAISVRIVAADNQDAIVKQEKGHLVTNAAPGTFAALRAERIGANTFRVYQGPDCAGPWTPIAVQTGTVAFYPTVRPAPDHQEMLQRCLPNGTRWYRGEFHVVDDGGLRLVNHVLPADGGMDGYLKGVVPRESPASWGDLGGGKGMHALRAQAVAARSYAQSELRHSYAKTCDTQSCQVYLGRAEQLAGTPGFKLLEQPNTDRAVDETSGQVRRHGNGAVARTEFSSSTGGFTAGGTFPAVPDDGDAIASNPNRTWTAKVPVSAIEAKFGKGTLQTVQVISRNGLGADGGRVTKVRLTFTGGAVERTGLQFRSDVGLKSDWFTVTNGVVAGYYALGTDGGVFAFGAARFHGSLPGIGQPVGGRDIAVAGNGGYWILGDNAGVYSFGGAPFFGSRAGHPMNGPPRQLVPTPSRNGYWIVASDGGVFAFGDAGFFGSTGAIPLNAPVVGMTPTKTGNGYWLVASDGGVFSFGDALFKGSTGNLRLNRPVHDIARTASGDGYWLLGEDGGLFAFGDAGFLGSLPGRGVVETAVDLDAGPTGQGYYITTAQGGVHAFGDVGFLGSPAGVGATSPTAALAIAG